MRQRLAETEPRVDEEPPRPTILFAYTIKGWGLPLAGDPLPEGIEALPLPYAIPETATGKTET